MQEERNMNAAQQETGPGPANQDRTKSRHDRRPTLTLRRILVPLDFSGKSRQALDFAVPLAEQYGGKISLIHVVEPVYSYPPPGDAGVAVFPARTAAEASRERLVELARELVPPDLLGRTLVRTGRAYLEIVAAADEMDADLIVIATHGYTGLQHALVGSTAERVVRHAHCPVLTVRRH
jgi:nucleotide-binding universal stress UspA family protein